MIYHIRGSCILFAIVFSYQKTNIMPGQVLHNRPSQKTSR